MVTIVQHPNRPLQPGDFHFAGMINAENAHVDNRFILSRYQATNSGGDFRITQATLTVQAICTRRQGTTLTPGLLVHEQGHFNIGILAARALSRHLDSLRAGSMPDLQNAINDAVSLHRDTRHNNVQLQYDTATLGGTAPAQGTWNSAIAAALAAPAAAQLCGYDL